jgi:hypothetical protein
MVSYRASKNTNKKRSKETTKERKIEQPRLLTLKHDLLKISVDLQTAFAAETHLAQGQWLKEQLNVVKLRMFQVGTRMQTVSRAERAKFSATKGIY